MDKEPGIVISQEGTVISLYLNRDILTVQPVLLTIPLCQNFAYTNVFVENKQAPSKTE